jgi:hypothetical protein
MLKPMRAQTIDAPPEPRSPLRQALAAAIEKHAEAERDYRAAAKLADDAHGSFLDALGARREAAAALADARERGGCLEILAAIDSEAAATVEVERLRAARERTAAETERPTGARRRARRPRFKLRLALLSAASLSALCGPLPRRRSAPLRPCLS